MVIYQTINLINGKKYIGKDKNNNPNYIGSGVSLKLAIKKYGKENFKKEILEYCNNINHLIKQEEYWLNYYDVENNKEYYNRTNKPFGNSGLSDETKKKISDKLIIRKWDKKWGELSGIKRKGIKRNIKKGKDHGNYNKCKSNEHKIKLSLSKLGKKHNKEWNLAIKNNRTKCILVKSKPIQQIDKNNFNIINEYNSLTEAKNQTKINGIQNVVRGLAKTAGGYIWKYKEELN